MHRTLFSCLLVLTNRHNISRSPHASRWLSRKTVACFLVLAAGIACPTRGAQNNEWTWVGGSSTVPSCTGAPFVCGAVGVYGTLGVSSPTNNPGARQSSATWTDKNGNLWLFGGFGDDSVGSEADLNDLWEFGRSTNHWKWVSGGNTIPGNYEGAPGNYGTLGKAAATNVPSGRSGAASWIDTGGNLWLYGGARYDTPSSYAELNDLWMFNVSTGAWTW